MLLNIYWCDKEVSEFCQTAGSLFDSHRNPKMLKTVMHKEKTFDAVKMMREVRDKIGEETQGMTLQEFQKYIAEKLKNSPFKAIGRKI